MKFKEINVDKNVETFKPDPTGEDKFTKGFRKPTFTNSSNEGMKFKEIKVD